MADYVAGMKPTGRAITAGMVLEVVYAAQALKLLRIPSPLCSDDP